MADDTRYPSPPAPPRRELEEAIDDLQVSIKYDPLAHRFAWQTYRRGVPVAADDYQTLERVGRCMNAILGYSREVLGEDFLARPPLTGGGDGTVH